MALFARDDGMLPKKRKAREIVVEGHLLTPARLIVALLTGRPKFAGVGVVFFVAGDTSRSKLFLVEIASVTGFAGGVRVPALERKFRRAHMIEAHRFPLRRLMAGLALSAVMALMDILELVAGGADCRHTLVFFVRVAGGARHLFVASRERKVGFRMIEGPHARPAILAVAALAPIAEAPLMRIGVPVAVDAAVRRAA